MALLSTPLFHFLSSFPPSKMCFWGTSLWFKALSGIWSEGLESQVHHVAQVQGCSWGWRRAVNCLLILFCTLCFFFKHPVVRRAVKAGIIKELYVQKAAGKAGSSPYERAAPRGRFLPQTAYQSGCRRAGDYSVMVWGKFNIRNVFFFPFLLLPSGSLKRPVRCLFSG